MRSWLAFPWLCLTLLLVVASAGWETAGESIGEKREGGSSANEGWVRVWGGEGRDGPRAVAVDSIGSVYVTGSFRGEVDFDPGPGVAARSAGGQWTDVFLSKFNSSGELEWVATWGGVGDGGGDTAVGGGDYDPDTGTNVAVDCDGNVYVTGYFTHTPDFDPGPDTVEIPSSTGYEQVFLSKFNGLGEFQWVRTGAPGSTDRLVIDRVGNIYVGSYFGDTLNIDPALESDEPLSNGGGIINLNKFDSNGNLQWARSWGGPGRVGQHDIDVDGEANMYIAGSFIDTVNFHEELWKDEHTANGRSDAFVCKLDSRGNFQWARTWGGDNSDSAHVVAADSWGNVFVAGNFYSTAVDFDPGPGIDEHTSNNLSGPDAFLSKFDPGGDFLWARTWGGVYNDKVRGMCLDSYGNVYVTGTLTGTVDFDPGEGSAIQTLENRFNKDAFLSKFSSDGEFQWVRTWGAEEQTEYWIWWESDEGLDVAVGDNGDIYVIGYFCGTGVFDVGVGPEEHTSNGNRDAFLIKFPPNLNP